MNTYSTLNPVNVLMNTLNDEYEIEPCYLVNYLWVINTVPD